MAGPWLYCISGNSGKNFCFESGSVPVSIEAYKKLLDDGTLGEDRHWRITINKDTVKEGDEVYIYAGKSAGDLGIVGYAEVQGVELIDGDWCLKLKFDLGRCRILYAQPIPAAAVRQWIRYPRQSVRDLGPFIGDLQQLLQQRDKPSPVNEKRASQ